MKYFMILFMTICVSIYYFPVESFSAEGVNINTQASKTVQGRGGDAAVNRKSFNKSALQLKYLKSGKGRKDDAEFSDYPKSFVVPKGVCETKEPVMVFDK
ncbi:MAG: hypothetical protein HY265_00160 [Deltaproteobacteria bacterium]|nr:hypothetical protein [Deltaproteobacteria bacterium]